MASDLSAYRVATGEKPISSSKFNNLVQKAEDTFNAIGDTSLMGFTGTPWLDLSMVKQGTATTGQYAAWNGSAWAPASSADVYYRKITEKDIVNTTTPTDLFNGELTVAANALGANGTLRIHAGGDYLNTSGSSRYIILQLKLGSQVLWDSNTSTAIAANANRRAWVFDAVVQALGATNAQRGSGRFALGGPFAATTGLGPIDQSSDAGTGYSGSFLTVAGTVDMTTGQTLQLLATHATAHAQLSIRLEHASVQVTA